MNRIYTSYQGTQAALQPFAAVPAMDPVLQPATREPTGLHELMPNPVGNGMRVGRQWLMDGWEPIEDWRID